MEASKAVFSLAKDRGIVYASYGGLTPIARFPDGPVTPVLERIARRLSEERGKPVNAGQVLQVWLKQQGIVIIRFAWFFRDCLCQSDPSMFSVPRIRSTVSESTWMWRISPSSPSRNFEISRQKAPRSTTESS